MVFHLGPLAPRPELGHVDTEETDDRGRQWYGLTRRQNERGRPHDPARGGHRASASSPRAASARPAFWDLLSDGRTATRGHHALRPGGVPLADRRRVRLRPRRPRPGRASRSNARTATSSSRWSRRERRCATPGSTSTAEDPWRIGVSLGTAVGGTTRLEHDYVAGQRAAVQRWDVDHRQAGPDLHRAFSPSTLASAVAERFGAHGPGADGLHRLHLGPRRGRLRLPHRRGGPGRHLPRRRLRLADLADHRGLLRRDQGDLAEQRRPGARLPALRRPTATGSSWARAARCSSWRSWSTPGPAARTCTARSRGYATFGNAYHMTGLTSEGLEMARGHRRRPRPRPARPDRDRLRQRARLGHQAERPPRDGRGQAGPGRARLQAPR